MNLGIGVDNIPAMDSLDPCLRQEIWTSTARRRFKDLVVLTALLGYALLVGLGGALGSRLLDPVLGTAVWVYWSPTSSA